MIRTRVTSAAVYTLLMLALVLALTGCSLGSTPSRATRPVHPPRPVSRTTAPAVITHSSSEPAVVAAVLFERAHCAWNWHEPRQAYLSAQQRLATSTYAAQLAAASDPTSWRDGVVAQKQTVACTVSDAARAVDAPSSASTVYVRMTVNTEITSTLGTFAGGQRIDSWLLRRVANRWLVAGTFEGG